MAEQTSTLSVTNISVPKGASRVRGTTKRVYTATKLTGPTPTNNGEVEYKTEIIRYDNAKGDNPITIGERNNTTGKIEWNSSATTNEKKNSNRLSQTSANQINDVQRDFIGPLSAAEKKAFNKAAGNPNKAIGSGTEDRRPTQGSRYSSGVKRSKRTQEPEPKSSVSDFLTKKNREPRNSFNSEGGGPLVYPIALRQNQQDYIKFDMLRYVAKGFGLAQTSGVDKKFSADMGFIGNQRDSNRESLGSVILPIPGGISDANSVDWGGGDTMNPMDAALAGAAMNIINNPDTGKGIGDAVSGAKAALEGSSGELKRAVSSAFAGAAAGVEGQVLSRSTGEVLNPNMELLFKGPSLRPFTFSFKLAPRSSKEAEMVIAILRFFKQGMAPIKSSSNLFLKSPNTFRLGYYHRRRPHRFLNKFKECALQSVALEYTPDGNYATYEDGVMTAYNLTLSFNELEPVFSNDYDDTYDSVGY
jgi:hypothetical protein